MEMNVGKFLTQSLCDLYVLNKVRTICNWERDWIGWWE